MRYHPTRTHRTRLTRYPTRHGRLSSRATWLMGVALVLAVLLATSL